MEPAKEGEEDEESGEGGLEEEDGQSRRRISCTDRDKGSILGHFDTNMHEQAQART